MSDYPKIIWLWVAVAILSAFQVGFSVRGLVDSRAAKVEKPLPAIEVRMPPCEAGEILYFHEKSQKYRCTMPCLEGLK